MMANDTVIHLKLQDEVTEKLSSLKNTAKQTMDELIKASTKVVDAQNKVQESAKILSTAEKELASAKKTLSDLKTDKASKDEISTAQKLVAQKTESLAIAKAEAKENKSNLSNLKQTLNTLNATSNELTDLVLKEEEKLKTIKKQNETYKEQSKIVDKLIGKIEQTGKTNISASEIPVNSQLNLLNDKYRDIEEKQTRESESKILKEKINGFNSRLKLYQNEQKEKEDIASRAKKIIVDEINSELQLGKVSTNSVDTAQKEAEASRNAIMAMTKEGRVALQLAQSKDKLNKAVASGIITQSEAINIEKRLTQELNEQLAIRNSTTNAIVRHIRQIESFIVSAYLMKQVYDATIGVGLEYNKVLENNSFGLSAIIASNTNLVDSQGELIDQSKKFDTALEMSHETLLKIKSASLETSATFPQLTEVFQQAIGYALKMGSSFGDSLEQSIDRTIELTKNLTNMGGAIGMSADLMQEEIRSIMSGDTSRDSKLAILLFGSPAQANQAMKDAQNGIGKYANNVYGLMKDKLKEFENLSTIDSYQRSYNVMVATYESFMGAMTDNLKNDLQGVFEDLTNWIDENKDAIVEWGESAYRKIKELLPLLEDMLKLMVAFKAGSWLHTGLSRLIELKSKYTNEVGKLNAKLLATEVQATATSKALKGVAISTGIGLVVTVLADMAYELFTANDNAEKLQKTLRGTAEEFAKMSKLRLASEERNAKTAISTLENELKSAEKTLSRLSKRNVSDTYISEQQLKVEELTNQLQDAKFTYNEILDASNELNKSVGNGNKALQEKNKQLVAMKNLGLYDLQETNKNLGEDIKVQEMDDKAKARYEIEKKYQEKIDALTKNSKDLKTLIENVEKNGTEILKQHEIEVYDEYTKAKVNIEKWKSNEVSVLTKKEADEEEKLGKNSVAKHKKYIEDRQHQYANYYAVTRDLSKLWQIEEQKLREDNTALTQTELTKLIEIKKQAFDKEHNLQKESYSISEIQQYFEMMGDYNNAWLIEESEFYKKWGEIAGENYPHLLETAKKEYFDKANEEQNKLLEKQNEIIDSFNDFKFDAETSGLNDIGKALYSISDLTKELNKEQDLYNKAIIASGNDKEKIAQIEKQHFSNQLSGYSSVASAMSGLFAQGSKEASAMQTIQLGLASVNAVNAVLTQGSGDPYTAFARMAVMAGTVASLMSSIGQTFSIGQMSYSSDSFSSMEANTGTGSVLGDTSAQSKSIVNSMSILEDFAEPQFAVLSQMNKYLASIDSKMGGVSALLYQNAGYGLGKGFEASDNQNISVNSEIAGTVLTAILGGGIGLAVDKLLGGVFSNMLGGITNSILGGLFGKTSTSLKDAGLYFADTLIQSAIDGIEGSTYQTITTTTKSWFSKSSSTNSYFNELDDEIETQFSLVLDNMYNSILVSGEILGKSTDNIENDLSDFVVSIGKISLKDKTADEIQEEISSVFSEIADDMAKDVYPLLAPFQQVGEGLFETLTRVATGIEEADYYIGRLGKTFNEINYTNIENTQGNVGFEALRQSIEAVELATYPTNNGLLDIIENLNATAEELYTVYISLDDLRDRLKFLNQDVQGLSSSMIYGAGSISELEDGFESYFENFLTQSEQLNYKISELEQAFASLGIETPKTKDDFKALLSSLDLTSESGQELYGRLITLSDAFAEVKDGVADTITSLEDSISDLTSNMKDDLISAFDDVRNSISSLQSIATSFLNSTTSSGNLSIEEQIISYNKLRTQFSSYFDKDGTLLAGIDNEKAQSVYSQMSSLANNISGENSTLRNSLIGQFSHDLANLDFTDQILQVELTGAQGTALTNLSINGVTLDVSQDASSQLNTIAKGYNWNLSDEMIGHLQSKYGWSDKLTTNIQTALDSDFDWSQPNATIQKYFTSKFGWTPTAQDITNLKSAYNWDATDGDVKNLKSKYGWSDKLTANIQTALNSDFDWSQPNATIQKYFTSKFGWTPTEDEIKKLKSSYNWDSNNKGLTTALTTLGKSYDWAYTDLANAVNGVSTYTVNGKKVLAFDWNNDNIIDATAIIGSDGTLEDIKAGVYSDESTTAISTISNLATAIKDYNTLLLNEVAKDTAGLSSATLNYGDYVGKQEQLDISKLLGTSYSNVQGLVTSLQELQPLDNLAQAKGINQLLGFTTGGTSYDTTTAGYIQQLIDEGVITDLTFQNQLTSVINQATSNKKIADAIAEFEADKEDWQTRYNSALASVTEDVQDSIYYKYVHTLRPDVARSYAGSGIRSDTEEQSKNVFTLWWNKNGSKEGAISIENYLKSEVNKLKLTDPTLVSLLKEKKLNGYMNGTSNMLDDQLAMFNQREIVIPTSFSDGIRQGEISLGNNDKLIDKIDDLINITTQQARQIQVMKEKIEDMNTRDMIKTAKGVA